MTHWSLATGCIYTLRLQGYFPTLTLPWLWHKENRTIWCWFFVHGSLFWHPHLPCSISVHWCELSFIFHLLAVWLTPVLAICLQISLSRSTLLFPPLFSAPEARLMDDIKAIPNFLLTFGPSQKGFLRDLGKERVRGWGIYSSNSLLIRSPWEGPFLYWRWLILLKQPRALSLLDAVSHFLSSLPRSRGRHRAAVMSSGACPLCFPYTLPTPLYLSPYK